MHSIFIIQYTWRCLYTIIYIYVLYNINTYIYIYTYVYFLENICYTVYHIYIHIHILVILYMLHIVPVWWYAIHYICIVWHTLTQTHIHTYIHPCRISLLSLSRPTIEALRYSTFDARDGGSVPHSQRCSQWRWEATRMCVHNTVDWLF